jgi:hypothetical protein
MFDADNLDALLSRKETAEKLSAHGFVTTEATLATLATRGGGPPFQKWGQRCVYRWRNSLSWARSRLSNEVTSTSELTRSISVAPNVALRGGVS